jgi:hypothetical protein
MNDLCACICLFDLFSFSVDVFYRFFFLVLRFLLTMQKTEKKLHLNQVVQMMVYSNASTILHFTLA